MTPPHSAAPLDLSVENFSSEAWDSSECAAAAREPLKALEQGEVVVVVVVGVAMRGRGRRGESE